MRPDSGFVCLAEVAAYFGHQADWIGLSRYIGKDYQHPHPLSLMLAARTLGFDLRLYEGYWEALDLHESVLVLIDRFEPTYILKLDGDWKVGSPPLSKEGLWAFLTFSKLTRFVPRNLIAQPFLEVNPHLHFLQLRRTFLVDSGKLPTGGPPSISTPRSTSSNILSDLSAKLTPQALKIIHAKLCIGSSLDESEYRSVQTSRSGRLFPKSERIPGMLDEVFLGAKDTSPLKSSDLNLQADWLAMLYADIVSIHPFLEGNGRATRQFCQSIASLFGVHLDWPAASRASVWLSSLEAFLGNICPMAALVRRIAVPYSAHISKQ